MDPECPTLSLASIAAFLAPHGVAPRGRAHRRQGALAVYKHPLPIGPTVEPNEDSSSILSSVSLDHHFRYGIRAYAAVNDEAGVEEDLLDLLPECNPVAVLEDQPKPYEGGECHVETPCGDSVEPLLELTFEDPLRWVPSKRAQ
jgi:hypothetical protein